MYNAATGERVKEVNTIDARDDIAISPDGRWLAAGQMRYKNTFWGERKQAVVTVYDFDTGEQVAVAEHPWMRERASFGHITEIEFSSDGRFLVTCSTRQTRVWRVIAADR